MEWPLTHAYVDTYGSETAGPASGPRQRPKRLRSATSPAATRAHFPEITLMPKTAAAGLADYRQHCVDAGQKAQEDFDKSVLSLSGGALGVSFAFLKDVIGPGPVQDSGWLIVAWSAWGLSIVAVLASFFFSQLALRTAVAQVDDNTIHMQYPGRWYARMTIVLNAAAGLLFFVGVIGMVIFVRSNFGHVNVAP